MAGGLAGILEAVAALRSGAAAATVSVLVPDGGRERALKAALAGGEVGAGGVAGVAGAAGEVGAGGAVGVAGVAGVEVVTWGHYFQEAWQLYGDGRTVAPEPLRRRYLALAYQDFAETERAGWRLPTHLGELSVGFRREVCYLLDFAYGQPALMAAVEQAGGQAKPSEVPLFALLNRYFTLLDADGFIDPVDAEQQLAARLRNQRLLLDGFVELSPRQAGIIAALQANNQVHWDAAACATNSQTIAEALDNFTGEVRLGEAVGPLAEVPLLADLIQQAIASGCQPGSIAVLTTAEHDAGSALLDELIRREIPFATSVSVRLAATPLGTAFLALLKALQPDGVPAARQLSEQLFSLLSSPYAGISREKAWRAQRDWRKQRVLDPVQLLASAQAALGERSELVSLARSVTGELVGEAWLTAQRELLNQLFANGRSSNRRSEAELQDDFAVLQAAYAFAEQVAATRGYCSLADLAEIPVTLNRSYQPSAADSCSGSVQLLPPQDLSYQSYDAIIIGSLNADSFPMSQRERPLDGLLTRMLGQPVKPRTADVQRTLLAHMLQAAGRQFVAYRITTEATGDKSRSSALWDELLDALAKAGLQPATSRIYEYDYMLQQANPATLGTARRFDRGILAASPSAADPSAADPSANSDAGQLASLMPAVFSVTELEAYLACPYKWFVSRRLKTDEIDKSLDARDKGTFCHEVLKQFYNSLIAQGHQRVTEDNLPQALELLPETFRQTLEAALAGAGAWEGHPLVLANPSEQAAINSLLPGLLALIERDASFLPGYHPAHMEYRISKEEPIEYAGVQVNGIVDRIDVNADGRAVVLDYKMPKSLSDYGMKKGATLPMYLQGAIYARLIQRQLELVPTAALYRSYTAVSTRGVYSSALIDPEDKALLSAQGLGKYDASSDFSALLDAVEEKVATAMERLQAGDIAPAPAYQKACSYCPVATFCPERRG
jgi:RecB family exonuclease